MVNWYKQEEKRRKPSYVDFAHQEEHNSLGSNTSFNNKYGEVFLWAYSNGKVLAFPLGEKGDHSDIPDSVPYDISGRYSKSMNMASIAGYGSPYNFINAIIDLEEMFGKNLKIFISEMISGNIINGTFTPEQLIKKLSNLRVQYANSSLKKIAQVQGEWWIQDGVAYAADGEMGDMDHIAYVINYAQSTISDMDIQSEEDWELWKYKTVQEVVSPKIKQIQQEMSLATGQRYKVLDAQLDELKDHLRNPEYYSYDLIFENASQLGIDPGLFNIAEGAGGADARIYGMKEFGWKRVEGRHVETWQLTKSDLNSIASGLWDAYQDDAEKATYNIEVRNPAKYFVNVPYQYIEDGNPAKLREYDASSGIDKGYRPRYASLHKQSQSVFDEFLKSPKKNYGNFGHPIDFEDSDPVYLWWYDGFEIITEQVLDADHVHDDSHGMVYWGRYIENNNALSFAWDPYEASEKTLVDALLSLEEKFGQDLKIFAGTFGKGMQGPMSPAQIIKQFSNYNENYFSNLKQWRKKAETLNIRDFYTQKPKSVYIARNPTWDQLLSILDKSIYGAARLLQSNNGEVIAWDGSGVLHSQIARAIGMKNIQKKAGPEVRMDEKYNIILYNPPGPYHLNNFFGKELKTISGNEYLVVEDELV